MKIADLVNKTEPFEFTFDGFVLKGEWFKYKTTTFAYGRKVQQELPDISEESLTGLSASEIKDRIVKLQSLSSRTLADTIKSWNAEDDDGNPVLPTWEVFEGLPEPFVKALALKFKELRENPTLPDSPST
jgi:hypothetical protein